MCISKYFVFTIKGMMYISLRQDKFCKKYGEVSLFLKA